MSECPELNAMIQHMTDDELEERRCGLKKEKFCCKKDVQGGNSICISIFYKGIIKFLWMKNFPQILQRDAHQVFSVRALALNNFHQNQEQTFQLCSLGINYYVVSEFYER